jgi:3-deoxy-D-manno-octulosonic-acid transferase
MYLIYSVLLGIGLLLASPYFLLKGRGTGKYLPTFWQRLDGRSPKAQTTGSIWVHAVSVGEVLAARPLIEALRVRFPHRPLFLSTTTVTGQRLARERMIEKVDGLFFAPLDFARPVRRVLDNLTPSLLVLMETEIWPNLIHEAHERGVRVAIANGRVSPSSFRGYRRIRFCLARVLADVDGFLMQGEAHAERIRALGAPPQRVTVTGNLKYDALEPPTTPDALARRLTPARGAPLWVAGSTMDGEEELVLEALRQIHRSVPGLVLVIAPRRPERFDAVADIVARHGFVCSRRSRSDEPPRPGAVVVLDTVGELASVYPLATVVFVGGSLVPTGGHNILEAAAAGKPVIVGPHMDNFREIAASFRRERALVEVASSSELATAVAGVLADASRRAELGERGRRTVALQRGAVGRTVDALASFLR